jgi:hypothetical protein
MEADVSAVDPAITAYLATVDRHIAATFAQPRDHEEYRAATRAREEAWTALTGLLTWWPKNPDGAPPFAVFVTPVSPAEIEHVWVPILAAQMECLRDEAAVAVALGMRPDTYPE